MKKKQKTSLPPSIKRAQKESPSFKINIHPLIESRDKGILHPEEYNVGAFGMSEKTRAAVLAHLEVKIEEYEGYLFGVRIFLSESIPFGKIKVCDPKSEIIDMLTVAEV